LLDGAGVECLHRNVGRAGSSRPASSPCTMRAQREAGPQADASHAPRPAPFQAFTFDHCRGVLRGGRQVQCSGCQGRTRHDHFSLAEFCRHAGSVANEPSQELYLLPYKCTLKVGLGPSGWSGLGCCAGAGARCCSGAAGAGAPALPGSRLLRWRLQLVAELRHAQARHCCQGLRLPQDLMVLVTASQLDLNNWYCSRCREGGGQLVCCDRCPEAWHQSCMGLQVRDRLGASAS
jgi:hypothetical protein